MVDSRVSAEIAREMDAWGHWGMGIGGFDGQLGMDESTDRRIKKSLKGP